MPSPSAAQIRKLSQNRIIQPVLVFLILTAITMVVPIVIPPALADTARPLSRREGPRPPGSAAGSAPRLVSTKNPHSLHHRLASGKIIYIYALLC